MVERPQRSEDERPLHMWAPPRPHSGGEERQPRAARRRARRSHRAGLARAGACATRGEEATPAGWCVGSAARTSVTGTGNSASARLPGRAAGGRAPWARGTRSRARPNAAYICSAVCRAAAAWAACACASRNSATASTSETRFLAREPAWPRPSPPLSPVSPSSRAAVRNPSPSRVRRGIRRYGARAARSYLSAAHRSARLPVASAAACSASAAAHAASAPEPGSPAVHRRRCSAATAACRAACR